jgi:hypothetical protein
VGERARSTGRECDLIEAGLNEAAATALSDEKKKIQDQWSATIARLGHAHNLDVTARMLLYGESRFLSVCDFKRLGVAKRSPTTTFTLEG